MGPQRCRELFGSVPVARLASVRPDGTPHLVPITFALWGDSMVSAIDHKPKRTRRLQRLENIAANPRVALLADHYDRTWSRLWWVRAEGAAAIVEAGSERGRAAIEALIDRYAQYRDRRPQGPVISVTVERWSGWEATG